MNENENIDKILELFPLHSKELGIDLSSPSGRFKWFVASILFGARISEQIASRTYLKLDQAGVVDSPDKIIEAGWDELVRLLDAGGYVRYDFSTATELLNTMARLKEKYGSLEELYHESRGEADLEGRLDEFKGIGPTTVQIFLRELRGIWNVNPPVSPVARKCAANLHIDLGQFKGRKLSRVETALVKMYLRCCKKGKKRCPLTEASCCAKGKEES